LPRLLTSFTATYLTTSAKNNVYSTTKTVILKLKNDLKRNFFPRHGGEYLQSQYSREKKGKGKENKYMI
jgi:hypothetical protein